MPGRLVRHRWEDAAERESRPSRLPPLFDQGIAINDSIQRRFPYNRKEISLPANRFPGNPHLSSKGNQHKSLPIYWLNARKNRKTPGERLRGRMSPLVLESIIMSLSERRYGRTAPLLVPERLPMSRAQHATFLPHFGLRPSVPRNGMEIFIAADCELPSELVPWLPESSFSEKCDGIEIDSTCVQKLPTMQVDGKLCPTRRLAVFSDCPFETRRSLLTNHDHHANRFDGPFAGGTQELRGGCGEHSSLHRYR